MAAQVSSSSPGLGQFQSVQKAMVLPTVGAAVGQVGAFYTKVKGAHSLLEWALTTAEASVYAAATVAAPFVAAPLAAGDAKMAAAIDELGRRVPLINEQPKVIVEAGKQAVLARITPQVKRVKSLKELSWAKANVLLSTAYGQKTMHAIDNGAAYAMQLLDTYLPPVGPKEEASGEIVAASSDPALHTMQTVGKLSSVAARRVWANLAYKVNELRNSGIELDVRRYIAALLAALHLAKVTSEQQQKEQEQEKEKEEKQKETADPPPQVATPPVKTQATTPPKSQKVKTTPEGKSKSKEAEDSNSNLQ